eukprot:5683210-Pyramimonas_sp.AAC.1
MLTRAWGTYDFADRGHLCKHPVGSILIPTKFELHVQQEYKSMVRKSPQTRSYPTPFSTPGEKRPLFSPQRCQAQYAAALGTTPALGP